MLLAEEDIPLPPPEADDDDFDPKAEAQRLLGTEAFIENLGFRFEDEKDAYRRYILDVQLKRPLIAHTRSDRVYPVLRIYARVGKDFIRFWAVGNRFDAAGALKRSNCRVWKTWHFSDMLDEYPWEDMKRSLNNLQIAANRCRTMTGFSRMAKRQLGYAFSCS